MEYKLNKLRPPFVAQILVQSTDEDHLMNIAEILQRLHDEYGFDFYSVTIANDIELLQDAGMDIKFVKKTQKEHHYRRHDFIIMELKILINMVKSARLISKDNSSHLISKISMQVKLFAPESMERNIEAEHRIKPGDEQIFYIVDTINETINFGKQIRFKYFEYDATKARKLQFNGYDYKLSQYRLMWYHDYFYVIGFNEKYQGVSRYHNECLNTMFRIFNTERRKVTLVCENSVMGALVDRIGENVGTYAYDMENIKAEVIVACEMFFSWVIWILREGNNKVSNGY